MDERELGEAFRDAVRDAPPASFDERDVIRAADHARARHSKLVTAGSVAGVVLLAGGVALGTNLFRDNTNAPMVASGPAHTLNDGSLRKAPAGSLSAPGPNSTESLPGHQGGKPPNSLPERSPKQGGDQSGKAGPGAGSTFGCGPVDRELAVALADELPAAADVPPTPVDGHCAAGSRASGALVRDGGAIGTVAVILAPNGQPPTGTESGDTVSRVAVVTAASGRSLTVTSNAQRGSSTPPFANRLPELAHAIAANF